MVHNFAMNSMNLLLTHQNCAGEALYGQRERWNPKGPLRVHAMGLNHQQDQVANVHGGSQVAEVRHQHHRRHQQV